VSRLRITLVGAGTGQAQLLRGLRRHPVETTAIVGITDNGGHTGILRRNFGIPAVGDVRNCIAALADKGSLWERMLTSRLEDGSNVGNLLLLSALRSTGSLSRACRSLEDMMGAAEHVMPVADDDAQVGVELESGTRIVGEWDIIRRTDASRVRKVFHRPALKASTAAVASVREADLVVLSPGTLFTGVLSCATATGLPQAIRRTRARLGYVLNIMTQPGQTIGMSARDHVDAVRQAVGRRPDTVIVNTGRPLRSHLRLYAKDGAEPVRDDLGTEPWIVRTDLVARRGVRDLRSGTPIRALPHLIRHDPAKLARIVLRGVG
jgi:uncharacterized cofD-like protein